jgi:hypothetical protein
VGVDTTNDRLHRDGPAGRFVIFLLLVANVFIRPLELMPALRQVRIYEILTLICLLLFASQIIAFVRWDNLRKLPSALCVIVMLPAIAMSQLSRGYLWGVVNSSSAFIIVLLFYLILVSAVTSASRFRRFMVMFVVFASGTAFLSLAQFHGLLELNTDEYGISVLERDQVDKEEGAEGVILQLQGSGVFSDPNDLAVMLVAPLFICLHLFFEKRGTLSKAIWLALFAVLMYAFAMTQSRGGLLALLGGIVTFAVARIGWRRAVPVAAVVLPLCGVLFAGRQTNINFSDQNDTAVGRVMLWGEGLELFKSSPLFGIGHGEYEEQVGHVAHNSFVHAYTELGFLGGSCFFATFYFAFRSLRLLRTTVASAKTSLHEWIPCLLSILVATMVGLCSISRAYAIPVYLVLGVMAVYLRIVAEEGGDTPCAVTASNIRRVLVSSTAFLVLTYLFVRVVT